MTLLAWLLLFGAVIFTISWLYSVVARDLIVSSDYAKMGGGLRAFFTGHGLSQDKGTESCSAGLISTGLDKNGVPKTAETRKFLP